MKNFARRIITAAAAAAVSVGLLGFASPAEADSSWGYSQGERGGVKTQRVDDSSWGY